MREEKMANKANSSYIIISNKSTRDSNTITATNAHQCTPPPPIHIRLVVAFCARPANGGGIRLPSVGDKRLYRGGQLRGCFAYADIERGSEAVWGYCIVI